MNESTMSNDNSDAKSKGKARERREAGSGCLIPPRLGISQYWAVQVRDANGKLVRRTRLNSGFKVKGELKPGCDPKLVESWTNISAARILLKEWLEKVGKGDVSVGHDPSQLHYADLRALYLRDYAEQGRKSLRRNVETGIDYVDCLPHLDTFMGYEQAGDVGVKISTITPDMIDKFKAERKADGAANAYDQPLAGGSAPHVCSSNRARKPEVRSVYQNASGGRSAKRIFGNRGIRQALRSVARIRQASFANRILYRNAFG